MSDRRNRPDEWSRQKRDSMEFPRYSLSDINEFVKRRQRYRLFRWLSRFNRSLLLSFVLVLTVHTKGDWSAFMDILRSGLVEAAIWCLAIWALKWVMFVRYIGMPCERVAPEHESTALLMWSLLDGILKSTRRARTVRYALVVYTRGITILMNDGVSLEASEVVIVLQDILREEGISIHRPLHKP